MEKTTIKTSARIEILRKLRGAMYDALKTRGVALDKPEQNYGPSVLLGRVLQEWDKDHELAEACRDTQRHHMSGAHKFGED